MNGLRWFVVMAMCLLAGPVLAAAPVGMICNLKGEALVNGDPARNLKNLVDGDKIECKSGGEVTVVVFGNGERFVVSQQGTIKNGTVQGGRSLGSLKGPSAEAVRTLGGARVGATLSRDPMPTSRVIPDDPDWVAAETRTIKWKPVDNANDYIFSIFDTHDNAVYTAITKTATADLKNANLQPGAVYIWKMTARKQVKAPDGRTLNVVIGNLGVRWGTVVVLAKQELSVMQAGVRKLEDLKNSTNDKSYSVLLAGVYRSYGLLKLALETLDTAGEQDAKRDLEYDLGNIGWFYSNPGVQPLRDP